MAELKPTVFLTTEQISFFHREGYLAIDVITTPEEVAKIRAICDSLFERKAGREEGNQFDLAGTDEEESVAALPQILEPHKYAPELEQIQYRVNALTIAKQLLGPEVRFLGEHAILKPARYGAETPWHQDEAYWDEALEPTSINVWMPLQEATVENGCMQFIPGSHKLDVLPHHTIHHDPRIHGLEVDFVDPSKAIACPLPPGGATVHHCRTLHYAGPNPTDLPRRAYILVYGLEPKARQIPRDFYWNKQKQTPREQRRRATEDRTKVPIG